MTKPSAVGSHVVAIHHQTLAWAVREVCSALPDGDVNKLKVRSGEHLAATLTTAFLGCAPISIDRAGEPDLVFDLSRSILDHSPIPRFGLSTSKFADFEVKSLDGDFRRFDAACDRAFESGNDPESKTFITRARSANDVLAVEGRAKIDQALEQLNRKSAEDHSKNVFLIAHIFDYLIVEIDDAPLIAHRLDPLGDVVGPDTIWVLWAPYWLTMWSAQHNRWVDLWFTAVNQDEDLSYMEGLDVLQHVENEFLKQTESKEKSPYIFQYRLSDD